MAAFEHLFILVFSGYSTDLNVNDYPIAVIHLIHINVYLFQDCLPAFIFPRDGIKKQNRHNKKHSLNSIQ